ncbi:MAG TPA: hypothetical protein PKA98_20635, partial [Acidimicrobiales bacterium]|nr:hypothetical protein [Acidimicrobiales bacterium]
RLRDEYREYVDEVQVRFTKALDDAVRSVQRQVRDGATTRLAELQRSALAALDATERAPSVEQAAREAQIAALDRELEAIRVLREQTRDEVRATMAAMLGGSGRTEKGDLSDG